MRNFVVIIFFLGLSTATVAAQSERSLKRYFEGKQVALRIALPEQTHGVDIYPERTHSLNFKAYAEQLSGCGAFLNRGDSAPITRLKVHANEIELAIAGTRTGFNIHFNRLESWMLTPATVVDALSRYVEFGAEEKNAARLQADAIDATGFVRKGVVHVGPGTTYLKQGLKPDDVISLLGTPTSISESKREGRPVLVYEFQRSGDRVLIAEFLDGNLISSRTKPRSFAIANVTTEN